MSFLVPGTLKKSLSASLFLKGNMMDEAGGKPEKAMDLLFPDLSQRYCLIAPKQIHSTRILVASPDLCLPARPEADGIFLNRGDILVSLRFADCFPVLISSPEPEPWVMVLHSGYKGTVKNIVQNGLSFIIRKYGKVSLQHAIAWVGPGIGQCCYTRRLDDPATMEGINRLPAKHIIKTKEEWVSINIGQAITDQLLHNGLEIDQIVRIWGCTSCDDSLYYSYRRNGTANRMMLVAGLNPSYQNPPFWWDNI